MLTSPSSGCPVWQELEESDSWEYCMLEIRDNFVVTRQIEGRDEMFGGRTGPPVPNQLAELRTDGWQLTGAIPIEPADPTHHFLMLRRARANRNQADPLPTGARLPAATCAR